MLAKELPWGLNFILTTCMFSMVRLFFTFTSVQASVRLVSLSAACRIPYSMADNISVMDKFMLHPVICSQKAKWFSAKSIEKYCKFTGNNKIV
jgi:hypothetical protein